MRTPSIVFLGAVVPRARFDRGERPPIEVVAEPARRAAEGPPGSSRKGWRRVPYTVTDPDLADGDAVVRLAIHRRTPGRIEITVDGEVLRYEIDRAWRRPRPEPVEPPPATFGRFDEAGFSEWLTFSPSIAAPAYRVERRSSTGRVEPVVIVPDDDDLGPAMWRSGPATSSARTPPPRITLGTLPCHGYVTALSGLTRIRIVALFTDGSEVPGPWLDGVRVLREAKERFAATKPTNVFGGH
jgi:hypothetical protein